MLHLPLSLMYRLNQTETAVFKFWMLYFQRISFQINEAGSKRRYDIVQDIDTTFQGFLINTASFLSYYLLRSDLDCQDNWVKTTIFSDIIRTDSTVFDLVH